MITGKSRELVQLRSTVKQSLLMEAVKNSTDWLWLHSSSAVALSVYHSAHTSVSISRQEAH